MTKLLKNRKRIMTTGLYFLDLYMPYLSIERNASSDLPEEKQQIYSEELGKMFERSSLQFCKFDGGEKRQLITFEVSSKYKVIIKRKATYCNITQKTQAEEDKLILNNLEIQKFLNEGLKEYYISRLLSAHPAGLNCYDFRVTKLPNINCLVYEFMMENVGYDLQTYIFHKKPSNFNGVPFFIEMVNILKFIEMLGLAYSDVKMGNFLVDTQGHLRITDYDTAQKAGFLSTLPVTGVTNLIGYTEGYNSPEAIKYKKRQENEQLLPNEKIDPWKADVYSCGIVGLVLLGALTNPEDLSNLDRLKNNNNDHKIISNIANYIKCGDKILEEKFQFIIQICIDYNPNQRPSFKQLSIMLENINDKKVTLSKLKEKWEKMMIEDQATEEFRTIVIKLLNEKTNISYKSNQIESYIKEVVSHLHEKIKTEKTKWENEQSLLLEKCIKPLEEFNEELPHDIQEIPLIIKKLLNKQNMPNKTIAKEIIKSPEKTKEKKFEITKENQMITTTKQVKKINEKNDEIFGMKYKNYKDAFNQIVNGGKLRKEIAEFIKSRDDWWYLEKKYNEAKKEEIINVLELVKYSEKIKILTFTENPNFDAECERAYLDAIKANNSLMTIILYNTNVSKKVTLEMLKMLEIKPTIKVLLVEKAKINEKDAIELAKKMKLEINNWESKYWNIAHDGISYWTYYGYYDA